MAECLQLIFSLTLKKGRTMSRLCKNSRRAPSLFKCNFIVNKRFTKNPTNTCHATYILFLKTELESQINVFYKNLPKLNAINNMKDFEF